MSDENKLDPCGGNFGRWSTDSAGQPAFDLTAGPDHLWHQVGNRVLTATAHAGGWTTLYSTGWGWIRLSDTGPKTGPETGAALGGTWRLEDGEGRVLRTERPTPTWGIGYAEWQQETEAGPLHRRVSALPGDRSALRVDVSAPPGSDHVTYIETWGFRPWPIVLGGLMSRRVSPPTGYGLKERLGWEGAFAAATLSRTLTHVFRRFMSLRLALTPEPDMIEGAVVLSADSERPARPTPLARLVEHVFVAPLDPEGVVLSADARGATANVTLRTNQPHLSLVVGLARDAEDVASLVTVARDTPPAGGAEAPVVVRFATRGLGADTDRESRWHAGMLATAATRDEMLDVTYVPQGSAYSFVHGIQGAPRDYALTAVPLAFVDPATARDMLRLMFRMQRPDGAIEYAHTGAGYVTGALIHKAPSDLPIWLLWALTEYVWATQDPTILDEVVATTGGISRSVRDGTLAAWTRLRDGVGLGAHGLLRVGSGDWNDPIAAMAPNRRAFHDRGESVFNSAFAAHALPRAAELVETWDSVTAAEMREFGTALAGAVDATWTGDWFLRGYDGLGGPLGRGHLFLDAQVWCLIAGIGGPDKGRLLMSRIHELCDSPSPIGATILDRPHPVRGAILQPGWDCNGGVWAAICGLLVWAYSLHDTTLAVRQWEKASLAGHARAHPDIWYGIWSGPDSYNSHLGEHAGETFVQPATPMTDFPVMNSNAHSGPLLGLIRMLGIETEPGGVVVRERPGLPDWSLTTALGEYAAHRRV